MQKRRQIAGLDALRFIAALLVVAHHLMFWAWTSGAGYPNPFPASLHPFIWFSNLGWIGVEMFFVLSGFVIAYSADGSPPLKFLQARWIRLFPAALICSSITGLLMYTKGPFTLGGIFVRWIRSIIFYPKGPYIDGSYWTLSIEVSFYLLVFFLLALRRSAIIPLVVGVIGSISTFFWIVSFSPALQTWLHWPLPSDTDDMWPLNTVLLHHGCYFALGVFLWQFLTKHQTPLLETGLMAFCYVGAVLQIIDHASWVNVHTEYAFSSLTPILVWTAFLGAIVVSVVFNEAFTNALGARGALLLRRLGLMTYPLYLLHQQIGIRVLLGLRRFCPELIAVLVVVAALLGLTYLISVHVEPLLQKQFRRWFAGSGASEIREPAVESKITSLP